jgi:hypothetical protein
MATQDQYQKTGATPLPEEDLSGARVLGIKEIKTAIVKMRDGFGKEMIKIVLVIPGGEIYYLNENAVSLRPAQAWAKRDIMAALKLSVDAVSEV